MKAFLHCANCQQEKEIDLIYGTNHIRAGVEIKKWLKEHKTRIGRTWCDYDFIGIEIREAA